MKAKLYTVHKRTFEARKYPKGSLERKELNKSGLTSEYNVQCKYCVKVQTSGYCHVDNNTKTKWGAEWLAKLCNDDNERSEYRRKMEISTV